MSQDCKTSFRTSETPLLKSPVSSLMDFADPDSPVAKPSTPDFSPVLKAQLPAEQVQADQEKYHDELMRVTTPATPAECVAKSAGDASIEQLVAWAAAATEEESPGSPGPRTKQRQQLSWVAAALAES